MSYTYNGVTNKSGDVYYFVYDPTASIPAVIYEQGPDYRYLNFRQPDGSLMCRETYDGDDRIASRTYHFDGLGSTVALSDESGTITDTYTYDAWGNLTAHTGTTTDNPYQYVGNDIQYEMTMMKCTKIGAISTFIIACIALCICDCSRCS